MFEYQKKFGVSTWVQDPFVTSKKKQSEPL